MSLSISDFQKIANGSHNAGDITLTGSGKLDKVNNHVGILKGWNTKTVSAATTLEVKNAFVSALKSSGVDEASIAKIREELGLPRSGGTKGLDMSSLKPLTRAQTREILDRFAGVINDKAGRTVVSNRWAALKAADIEGYNDLLARAAEVNQKSAATRAAAQKKLGADIMNYGAGEIPSNIRKSCTYVNLSEANKEKFKKIFTAMLFHGGADVDSIAAEAMKKVLVAKYGSGIQDEAERDLFKGLAASRPATTDLARIEQDVKDAKKAAAAGAKLKFPSNGKEMSDTAYVLRTTGGLGFNVNKTAARSRPANFAANLASDISKNETFLRDVVAKFGAHVKDFGTLELDGAPTCKITKLENGNVQLVFDIKAGIAGGRAFAGDCFLKVVVDPNAKTLEDVACKMKLEPGKFTARDAKPVELHKMQIIENANKLAADKGFELEDEEINGLMDQMSQWEDIKPGQLKVFEQWVRDNVNDFVHKSIDGIPLGGEKKPIEFDEDGLCTQFKMDSNRAQFTIGTPKPDKPDENGEIKDDAKVYRPGAAGLANENKAVLDHVSRLLPNKADRMFISGLINQTMVSPMLVLIGNARTDPDDDNSPVARQMDPAGQHVANCLVSNDEQLLGVMQPHSQEGSRYELRVDNKNKTATLVVSSDFEVKPHMGLRDGDLAEKGMIGKAVSSYEIKITGLGSGRPVIASVGFSQKLEALDM